jgi:ribosome-binding factor A
MSSTSWFTERVSQELIYKISAVISQRLRDPRIPPIVTITGIRLADDLRNATVFTSILGEGKTVEAAVEALNHAAPYIQRVVAASMNIRHFPRLYFKTDTSIERSMHINDLLKEVKDDLEKT